MGKPDELSEIVKDLVRKHPNAPARTLGRRLVKETNGALTLDQARLRICRAMGVQGKRNRSQTSDKSAYRKARAAGELPAIPPSLTKPWSPYDLAVTGRVGVLSDIHIPFHHPVALKAAIDHLTDTGIDALLLNGDIADFYRISHWVKRPLERDFAGELDSVRTFLALLRKRFPRIPIVYKLGNHEERWERWLLQRAPEISDEPEMGLDVWLRTAPHNIEIIGDQRIVMLGTLPVLHGHELPKGISSPVNAARGAFMRTHHTVLVGHQHQTSGHCEPNMFHDETFVWSTGCLCGLNPEYARFNRWNLGFAVVTVHRDGEFDVSNLRITNRGSIRSS